MMQAVGLLLDVSYSYYVLVVVHAPVEEFMPSIRRSWSKIMITASSGGPLKAFAPSSNLYTRLTTGFSCPASLISRNLLSAVLAS